MFKDLTTVGIYVDHFKGEEESAKRLKTKIELRMRQAGIKIGRGPTLVIGRSQVRTPYGIFYRLQIEVQETVLLSRPESLGVSRKISVSSWKADNHRKLIFRDARELSTCEKEFEAGIDQFLNEYLQANPK